MSLRGVHINTLDNGAMSLLQQARPALVKTLDFGPDWAALKADCDIRFLLGRVWCDDDAAMMPTPERAAERLWKRVWGQIQRHALALDAIETPWNEAHQWGVALEEHGTACRRFCELAHGEGIRVAVGNFSVGNPEPSALAASFVEGLEAADYLSLHEYWLPDNFNAPWWVGRWRRLLDALPENMRRPVIISECGIDGGLEGRGAATAGWRAYGLTGGQYAPQLAAYVDSLDSDVLGVAVFNAGDYPGGRWGSFEIGGASEVAAWLRAGPREWGGESDHDKEDGKMSNPWGYIVGSGFVDKATVLGWTILSDEIYHDPADRSDPARTAFSECFCDLGRLYFHAATGVVAVPFAEPATEPDHK